MSKSAKSEKVLIRNSTVPIRSCRAVGDSQKLKKVHFAEENLPSDNGCTNGFKSPEFCTVLQITDEIKRIRSAHGSTSASLNGPRYRNLNFLPEEKIFQNLIDLELPEKKLVTETKSQPLIHSNLKKDWEPDLNEFLDYSLLPEYSFPSYNTLVKKKQKKKFDGRCIFHKINVWEEKLYHM